MYLLSLWYRLLSINIRLIVLLAVPYCHIIAFGGIASLKFLLFTTFSRHSAWHLVATWVPPYYKWWRFMSPKRIDSVSSVSSRLIADIIFFVCGTPVMLGLYILIIYTSPLYIWIVIIAIFKLTGCYDCKAEPISLLTIKYIYMAVFGLYRSWNF